MLQYIAIAVYWLGPLFGECIQILGSRFLALVNLAARVARIDRDRTFVKVH